MNLPQPKTPEFHYTPTQYKALETLRSDAMHNALGGGSRSGKTFLLVRAVIARALKAPGSRHVIFRFRFNSVKASVILDTFPKVLALCFPEIKLAEAVNIDKTDWYAKFMNGSEIWFAGLDDKDRTEKVLGMEFATIYFNECSQIPYQSVVLAKSRLAQKCGLKLKFYYDLNPPAKAHWTYQVLVNHFDPLDRKPLSDPENYTYFTINPADNTENLAPEYLKVLEAMPEASRKRFLLGQFSDATDGQLWTEEVLATNRHLGQVDKPLPQWLRIVVAVDPSGTKGEEDERSDEVGITVNALGTDGHGYLLEDLSGKYSPEEWGKIAADAWDRHNADCVIGEVNFGGDMVRAIIQASNPNVPYREVRASRGKVIRAEPISHLYEQGKIHHVGFFPEIEEQMLGFLQAGYVGLRSPDRADSVVWGMTSLFPGLTQDDAKKDWRPPPTKTRGRSASRYGGRSLRGR